MGVAKRTIDSTAYNITASIIQTVIQFARQIILVRLLAPATFGIYAYAFSWIVATRAIGQFGLGSGLLHRARESEGEIALRTHFTLSLVFSLLWLAGLCILGPLLIPSKMPTETVVVLWVLAGADFVDQITLTARTVLVRRIAFRRIALMDVGTTVFATVAAIVLALKGFGVWSLVATDLVGAAVLVLGYYVYRPIWRPRFGWSRDVARYLLGFGRKTFLAGLLLQALDRVDDLWTGVFLGETSLGFYSRAYRFATYPRAILASPLNSVASGTYAELKDRPKALSQAFFRINALLVRSGFLLAGLLALIAPEFIRIVMGAEWLPMLSAFRLMLVFTLLDPIKGTVASLFVAVGYPEKTVRARSVQLLVLVVGLFALGPLWGIAGVALAVDLMLVVGIALLLWQSRVYVQFSVRRLFAVPAVGLVLGMIGARAAILIPGVIGSPWRTGAVKAIVYIAIYGLVLLLLERDLIPMLWHILRQLLPRKQSATA